jgi:hypothetical protein
MRVLFLNNLSGHTSKRNYVWKNKACFTKQCAKPTLNRIQGLGTKTVDSFFAFNMKKIACLREIDHESYYIQDDIELFIIDTRKIRDLRDFLIFEKHTMFPPTILSPCFHGWRRK